MVVLSLSELSGKEIVYRHFGSLEECPVQIAIPKMLRLHADSDFSESLALYEKLGRFDPIEAYMGISIKVDQLIPTTDNDALRFRGSIAEAIEWFEDKKKGGTVAINGCTGTLDTFLVEPAFDEKGSKKHFIEISSHATYEKISYRCDGHQASMKVDFHETSPTTLSMARLAQLIGREPDALLEKESTDADLLWLIDQLYNAYKQTHMVHLRIDPLVVSSDFLFIDELRMKVDGNAEPGIGKLWSSRFGDPADIATPFGRDLTYEEAQIRALKSPFLKFYNLSPEGDIWTFFCGGTGHAYMDLLASERTRDRIANFGEHSIGASEEDIWAYTTFLLNAVLESDRVDCKHSLVLTTSAADSSSAAPFFTGLVRALKLYGDKLKITTLRIFLRHGGSASGEGVRNLRTACEQIGIKLTTRGHAEPMASFVDEILQRNTSQPSKGERAHCQPVAVSFLKNSSTASVSTNKENPGAADMVDTVISSSEPFTVAVLPEQTMKAIVIGNRPKFIQDILDFDHVCQRDTPSIVGVYGKSDGSLLHYIGHKQVAIPMYSTLDAVFASHKDVNTIINVADAGWAYETTNAVLSYRFLLEKLKTVFIISGPVSDYEARRIGKLSKRQQVTIVGPGSVGTVLPGRMKAGLAGGTLEDILMTKLYNRGQVAYVTRSAELAVELNRMISENSSGVYAGIVIGGSRFAASSFLQWTLLFSNDPNVKAIVLLGEAGGDDEYEVIEAMNFLKKKAEDKKNVPMIAYCINFCGDSGLVLSEEQTASKKTQAFRDTGAIVPSSLAGIGAKIRQLVEQHVLAPRNEQAPPPVALHYDWAVELGFLRQRSLNTSHFETIRGQLCTSGVPINRMALKDGGVCGMLSNLWMGREMPEWFTRNLSLFLVLFTDVSSGECSAYNATKAYQQDVTITQAVASGLVAQPTEFTQDITRTTLRYLEATECGVSAEDFANEMLEEPHPQRHTALIPDPRLDFLMSLLRKEDFWNKTPLLKYAHDVGTAVTAKDPHRVLSLEVYIGILFVDMLRHTKLFSENEVKAIVRKRCIDGLFLIGRSIGLIACCHDAKTVVDDSDHLIPDLCDEDEDEEETCRKSGKAEEVTTKISKEQMENDFQKALL
ncbi:unnamed protein product, partial [Mesorhabditis spiculigera]